ncbi:LysR family transcriptional regulator [Sinosporangium album]|uniref:LysR family transcriptional regulator n=1 Tax=Sinosporangium album TaxID=504805 RepID=UPI000B826907|nr:LysR family transcriptional regulator [Sinosporangium album]
MHGGTAELDLGAVRAFVAIAEDHSFSEAAARLGISQQAVSKRIAKLESDLGLRLFHRSRAGTGLTEDGSAFLAHARALVGIADRALDALRVRRRTLRIDVLDTRLATIELVRAFHRALTNADIEDADIEIVTSDGLRTAPGALLRGSADAAFARVSGALEEGLVSTPAHLEPVHLLVGRDHPLADRQVVKTGELAGATVWMPGNAAGSEWADYYRFLSAEFGIRIDTAGPNFGYEHMAQQVASGERMSFAGMDTQLPWQPGVTRIPLVDPVPVYPWSLLRHRQNRHPALELFVEHIAAGYQPYDPRRQWLPDPDRAAFSTTRT